MKTHPFFTSCTLAYRLFSMPANAFRAVTNKTILFISLSVLSLSLASAAVTYQYTGNNYGYVGVEPPLSVYDTSMSVQLSFAVESQLISVNGDISHLVTSYTLFDGVHTLTEANSDLEVISVTTDGVGNITDWIIEASNISHSDPTATINDSSIYITTSMSLDMAGLYDCFDLTASDHCVWRVYDGASISNAPGSWSTVPISPVPDIKVNSADGPLTLAASDTLRLSLHLDNNGLTEYADWWLAGNSPYADHGLLFWIPTAGWTYAWRPAYQGRLYNMRDFSSPTIPVSVLAPGRYKLYFGVDLVMDGDVTWSQLYVDSIELNIVP